MTRRLILVLLLAIPSMAAVPLPYSTIANFPFSASAPLNGVLYTALLAAYPAANSTFPCVTVQIPWGSFDNGTTAPNYLFSNLDTNVAAIWANGGVHNGPNCINFAVAPVPSGTNNTYTPVYVFTAGYQASIGAVRQQTITVATAFKGGGSSPYGNASCTQCTPTNCSTGCRYTYDPAGVTGVNDHSGFPELVPAEPITTAWLAFANALLAHMASANYATLYNTQYVRFGVGTGAEANIAGVNFWIIDAGFSSAEDEYVLHNNISEIATVYTALASYAESNNIAPIQLDYNYHAWNPTNDTAAANKMAAIINTLSPAGGIDTNGLQISDITNVGNEITITSNWYGIHRTYRAIPFAVLQTFSVSDATNGDPNGCGAGNPCAGATTGSLAVVLPFAGANYANVFEIYPQDFLVSVTAAYASLPVSIQPFYPSASYSVYGGSGGSYNATLKLFIAGALTAPGMPHAR